MQAGSNPNNQFAIDAHQARMIAGIVSAMGKNGTVVDAVDVPVKKAKKHRNRKRQIKFIRQDTEVNALREFALFQDTWTVEEKLVRLAVLKDSIKAFDARQVVEKTTLGHEGVSNFLRQDTEVNDLRRFVLATEANETKFVNEIKEVLLLSSDAFRYREELQTKKDPAHDAAYKKKNEGVTGPMHAPAGTDHRQLQDAPDDNTSTTGYTTDGSSESAPGPVGNK